MRGSAASSFTMVIAVGLLLGAAAAGGSAPAWATLAGGAAHPSVANVVIVAHGALKRSIPRNGARLDTVPRTLRLEFTEPVELAVARVRLLDPDSMEITLRAPRHDGDARVVVADIAGSMQAGRYTVEWQIAGRDGHPVRGRFSFLVAAGAVGIGAPTVLTGRDTVRRGGTPSDTSAEHAEHAAEPDTAPPVPEEEAFDASSPLYAAVRWLTLLGIVGVVGVVTFRFVALDHVARRDARLAGSFVPMATKNAVDFGMFAASTLMVAIVLRLIAQSVALNGTTDAFQPALLAALVRGTTWGWGWSLQAVAVLLIVVALALARRGRRSGWALGAVAASALALSAALSGHAAATPRLTSLAVIADSAHVLAAGTWLGTLLLILVAGVPAALRLSSDARGLAVRSLIAAFSPVALASASLLLLTGSIAAWLHLGSVAALWQSTYGRTLMVKLCAIGLVGAAGAYNWLRVKPTLGTEHAALALRRSATIELVLAAVVLAVTAVLVATPPAVE